MEDEPARRRPDRKTLLPIVAIGALILVPVAIWAASSGGSEKKLRVEQAVSAYGGPEIVVNVPRTLNNADEVGGKARVKLICVDASGATVFTSDEDWPFINEPGYPYPHAHRSVTPKQLQAIAKCRLEGTKTKLEGNLRRT